MSTVFRQPRPRFQRRARAFTLLEVTLAAVLGTMVVFSCLALFGAIDRAQKRHELRVAQTNDFTRAYQIIERSLRLLVMAEQADANDTDSDRRIDRDLERARGTILDDDPLEAQTARFLLLPDTLPYGGTSGAGGGVGGGGGGGMLEYQNQLVPAQALRLTLRAPPVAGGFAEQPGAGGLGDNAVMNAVVDERARAQEALERARASRRAEHQTQRTAAGSRGRASSRSEPQVSGGAGDVGRSDAASDTEEEFDPNAIERPRAPGVHAEFILLPDGSAPTSALQAATATSRQPPLRDPDSPRGWTLWYREVPPRLGSLDLSPEDRARALAGDASVLSQDIDPADLAYQVDPSSLRVIRLVSGLKTCYWRVFRRGEFAGRIQAVSARELPAYVELSLETLGGRRENWMFEVGWTQGVEPGQLLALANDPLNADNVNAADIDGDGVPDNQQNSGNDNNTGGGGSGGGGNGVGVNPPPIDLGGGVRNDPTTRPTGKVRPTGKPSRDPRNNPAAPTR